MIKHHTQWDAWEWELWERVCEFWWIVSGAYPGYAGPDPKNKAFRVWWEWLRAEHENAHKRGEEVEREAAKTVA